MNGTGLTGTGSGGADTLLSIGGANILVGLGGDDLYFVNNSGDTVTETGGRRLSIPWSRRVNYAMPAKVEALYMIGAGLTGTGSGGADTLLSTGGANILVGLGGDDIYYVNNSGDVVTEARRRRPDTVAATVNYTMPANVEALYMLGSGLTGTGSSNADTLLSSGGPNILVGLGGDDFFYVNNTADVVTEAANGGFDSVHGIRQLHPVDQCRGAVHEWFRANRYRYQQRRHLVTLGANTLVGGDGDDRFLFLAGSANGATVADSTAASWISWCSAASAPRRKRDL